MKSMLLLLSLFAATSFVYAGDSIGQSLLTEYKDVRAKVSRIQPEFDVGGYNAKDYGDYRLIWRLAETMEEAEMIRIYRAKGLRDHDFDVTYHRNRAIAPGRTVVRRFVGPMDRGWRNDTVDIDTGEYLGRQGAPYPRMDARDREILEQWGMQIFEDDL
ncbi:MAG: hypothetical protein AB7G93_10240 [Bdellovibrionales bacterium]